MNVELVSSGVEAPKCGVRFHCCGSCGNVFELGPSNVDSDMIIAAGVAAAHALGWKIDVDSDAVTCKACLAKPMDFGGALSAMRSWHRVRRRSWEPRTYIFLSPDDPSGPRSIICAYYDNPETNFVWRAWNEDLVADDWEIVD